MESRAEEGRVHPVLAAVGNVACSVNGTVQCGGSRGIFYGGLRTVKEVGQGTD